jgi:hypothetical protein
MMKLMMKALRNEAARLGATIATDRTGDMLEIVVTAPDGKVWAATQSMDLIWSGSKYGAGATDAVAAQILLDVQEGLEDEEN